MKKLYLMIAVAAASTTAAHAQWNTNAVPKCLYSTTYVDSETGETKVGGDYFACNPKVARTPDKKTWMAWKSSRRIPKDGGHLYGEDTYLMLLDRDGNAMFDEPILVNNHATPSWWSNYSLCVAADGSAIVTVSDSRGEEDEIVVDPERASTSGQVFQPAVYKIDQEGNFLWGLDGITYPKFYSAAFTYAQVVGSNTFFIFVDTSDDNSGTYIQRIDDDGIETWSEPRLLDSAMSTQYQILPSNDGDFLLFHHTPDGANVTRYDADFNEVWETVTYDEYYYGGYEMSHYKIVPDGSGGAVVGFLRYMGTFAHNVRVQHINEDGSLGFGLSGLDAYAAEAYDHNYLAIGANPATEEILVQFSSKLGNTGGAIMHQKFSYDGDYLYDEPAVTIAQKTSSTDYMYDGNVKCVGALPDGSWITVYGDMASYNKESLVIRRYDKEGNRTWNKIIGRELGVSNLSAIVEPEAVYLFYRETREEKEPGIKIFRIGTDGTYNVDYSSSIDETGQADSRQTVDAVFSLDGKQLSRPQKGFNLVRMSDGAVQKRLVK